MTKRSNVGKRYHLTIEGFQKLEARLVQLWEAREKTLKEMCELTSQGADGTPEESTGTMHLDQVAKIDAKIRHVEQIIHTASLVKQKSTDVSRLAPG